MGSKNSGYRGRSHGVSQAFKRKTHWNQRMAKQLNNAYNSEAKTVLVPREQFLRETGHITPLMHYDTVPPPQEE